MTGDLNSKHGNCATFLLKMEGVLDGLFQDMVATGSSESKVSHAHPTDIFDYQEKVLVHG